MPANITLLSLLPYSPELNPMENVWDHLRQNKLCARVWDTYDDIVDACKTAWNWPIADPARITSISARDRACVNRYSGFARSGIRGLPKRVRSGIRGFPVMPDRRRDELVSWTGPCAASAGSAAGGD